jgi:hypothetical protein
MRALIRRCVECSRCRTRYLVGFSPYWNGTFLLPTTTGSFDTYTLYCSCSRPSASSVWKWSDMKPCTVAKPAHSRGYGSFEEIVPLHDRLGS